MHWQKAANLDESIGVMGPVFWEWQRDLPNYYMRGRCPELIESMLDSGCSRWIWTGWKVVHSLYEGNVSSR